MKVTYGLIGAGGYGREVMPIVNDSAESKPVFVAEDVGLGQVSINGFSLMSLLEFLELEGEKRFNVAIGDSRVRERIVNQGVNYGFKPFAAISSNSVVMDGCAIGEGVILSPFVTITSNVKIGRFFHANLYSYVAHDCVIGDFVTFAPSVKCNGNVVVENHAYIGTGAIIKQGSRDNPLIIGEGAVIGMGAVVTKSVPANTVVVGNPARIMEKK